MSILLHTAPQPDPEASDWIRMLERRGFTSLVLAVGRLFYSRSNKVSTSRITF